MADNQGMPPECSIGKCLRDLRERAGLTQTELAQRIGHSQGFVSKYEHGVARMFFDDVAAVCDALGAALPVVARDWLAACAQTPKDAHKRSRSEVKLSPAPMTR